MLFVVSAHHDNMEIFQFKWFVTYVNMYPAVHMSSNENFPNLVRYDTSVNLVSNVTCDRVPAVTDHNTSLQPMISSGLPVGCFFQISVWSIVADAKVTFSFVLLELPPPPPKSVPALALGQSALNVSCYPNNRPVPKTNI
ncbi:Hypothetical predicted protein [Scomber scombrus]|uniref:Uncharacterized protein n=1 Tax=Scomber scombrus TaxID=13677 RepID=A0AAV1P8I2_SCOSC